MDINKIYKALQSRPLKIEQKTLLIEAFISGEPKVQQHEVPQQEDTRIEDLTREVKQLKETVEKLTEKLNEIVLPVRAISNIKNLEVSKATIPTIVGAINTLLVNFRTAGIIQM